MTRRLQARVATQQEELVEMRKKFERSRGDLKQRTVDVHMLQVTADVAAAPPAAMLTAVRFRSGSPSCAGASSTG